MDTDVSSLVVTLCDSATGGVLIGASGAKEFTVMETFPVLLVEVPSLAVNVKLSDPVYPLSGL